MKGSIAATALDRAALPVALLDLAKSHLRVDGTHDDAYIKDAIGRAISWFERYTNVSVNKVTWIWKPGPSAFCLDVAQVPVSPVNTTGFKVEDGAADVTADYALTTMSTHGIGLYAIEGGFIDGMQVTLPSGYVDVAALDPGITDAILRYTAHLYENREILVAGSEAATPGWTRDVIATYWMPRV